MKTRQLPWFAVEVHKLYSTEDRSQSAALHGKMYVQATDGPSAVAWTALAINDGLQTTDPHIIWAAPPPAGLTYVDESFRVTCCVKKVAKEKMQREFAKSRAIPSPVHRVQGTATPPRPKVVIVETDSQADGAALYVDGKLVSDYLTCGESRIVEALGFPDDAWEYRKLDVAWYAEQAKAPDRLEDCVFATAAVKKS